MVLYGSEEEKCCVCTICMLYYCIYIVLSTLCVYIDVLLALDQKVSLFISAFLNHFEITMQSLPLPLLNVWWWLEQTTGLVFK